MTMTALSVLALVAHAHLRISASASISHGDADGRDTSGGITNDSHMVKQEMPPIPVTKLKAVRKKMSGSESPESYLPESPESCAAEEFKSRSTVVSFAGRATGIRGLAGIVVQYAGNSSKAEERKSSLSKQLNERLGVGTGSVIWNTAFDDRPYEAFACLGPESNIIDTRRLFGLAAKHFLTYYAVAQMDNATNVLVLEDDMILTPDAKDHLLAFLDSVEDKAYDLIFLSSCSGIKINFDWCRATEQLRAGGEQLYRGPWEACTGAYLVRPSGAKKLLEMLEPGEDGIRHSASWQIMQMVKLHGGNYSNYVAQPSIALKFADGHTAMLDEGIHTDASGSPQTGFASCPMEDLPE